METYENQILYIDDEKENLLGFKYVFKKFYKIHIASSANEGWEILKNNEIKVIITDQRMPVTTGVQFLEKAAIEFPLAFRIILTGFTDVKDIIEAINKGKIFQFIRKPWDKDEVKVIIDNAIKLFDLKKQNKQLLDTLQLKNEELENINKNLENIIDDRTNKIEKQNRELEKHRNNLEELVKQRTQELELAKEKAEESDRLKSSFLANVSHEIRTPMNAIIGFSELMLLGDYSNEEKEEFKKNIYSNSETLLRLIDDILDISKIEANQININCSKHDLNEILDEANNIFKEYRRTIKKNEIDIVLEKSVEGKFYINTDKIRLHQILSNLLNNALKFTDKGSIRFGYNTVTEGVEKVIRFYVVDTGVGIPESAREYIFDRFRKGDNNEPRLFRGAGLGLSICKSLVEKLKGKIWFESNRTDGTTFWFEIPLCHGETTIIEKEEDQTISNNMINKYDFSGKNILIAEDEDSTFLYLEMLLKDTNLNIFWAKNGEESVEIFKKEQDIDMVLMDIQMPIMNGYEALSQIKQINKNIPVVAQTAYAFADQTSKLSEAGFDDILPKPYKSVDLLSKISKYIACEV